MAAVPPCGLKCLTNKAYEKLKTNKYPVIIYSIFYVLLIENISFFIRYLPNYACIWYPLLTQISFFFLFLSIFLWYDRLRFCFLKQLATLFLTVYYLFGAISLIFQFSEELYSKVISTGLIIISAFVFIMSIFKKE